MRFIPKNLLVLSIFSCLILMSVNTIAYESEVTQLGFYKNSNNILISFIQCLEKNLSQKWLYEATENYTLSGLSFGLNNTIMTVENEWFQPYQAHSRLLILDAQNGTIVQSADLTTYDNRGIACSNIIQLPNSNRVFILGTQYIPTPMNNRATLFEIDLLNGIELWSYNLSITSMNTYSVYSMEYCQEDGHIYSVFRAAVSYITAGSSYLVKIQPIQSGTRLYKSLTSIDMAQLSICGDKLFLAGTNVSNTNELILSIYKLDLTLISSQSLVERDTTVLIYSLKTLNVGKDIYFVDRINKGSGYDYYFSISYFGQNNDTLIYDLYRSEYYGQDKDFQIEDFEVSSKSIYVSGSGKFIAGTNYGFFANFDRFDTQFVDPTTTPTNTTSSPYSFENIIDSFMDKKNLIPLCLTGGVGLLIGILISRKKK